MSKPEQWTARELAAALLQYGDLPVAVSVVRDDAPRQSEINGPWSAVRPELTMRRDGSRVVALTAYPYAAGFDDQDDDDDGEVIARPEVPADFPVAVLTAEDASWAKDFATCGECGRSWDDAVATSWTPAPSGRCPFESFH